MVEIERERLVAQILPKYRLQLFLRSLVGLALATTAAPLSTSLAGRPLPLYDISIIAVAIVGLFYALHTFGIQTLAAHHKAHHKAQLSGVMPGAIALVLGVIVSGLVHPSRTFLQNVLIILGAVIVGQVIAGWVRSSRVGGLLRVVSMFVFGQFVVSMLQMRRDGVIGGRWFGESESGFRRIGGVLSPSGTLVHANALGSVTAITTVVLLALLAQRPNVKVDRMIGSVAAVASASLTVLSLTRSAVASLILAVIVAGLSTHRKVLAPTIAAIMLAGVASGIARSGAWVERGRASTGGLEAAGSGRVALARQAVALFRLDPVFGVGPGHYFSAIRDHPLIADLSTETVAVHNVWLYVLATLGSVGVVALAWLSIDIIRRAQRGGFWAIGMLVALVPPLMLDAAPFMGCGLMWTAAAIGCVIGLCAPFQPKQTKGVDQANPVTEFAADHLR